MDHLLLTFPEYLEAGQSLAAAADMECAGVEIHRFPDGESRVRLPRSLPRRVVLCRTLDRPNGKLIELMLAAEEARALGAQHVTLVAPYLCYMRQDKAFQPGEAVSQRSIGRFLAGLFDEVVTVDPHLHRVHRLVDAIPAQTATALAATGPMAAYLSEHIDAPYLVGPDEESEQWVAAIAKVSDLDYGVARKVRLGDRRVEVTLPGLSLEGRNLVLVDDVVSSGRTLAACALECAQARPASITALVTHALFADDALDAMTAAGIHAIWSTDSIPHSTNCIPLASLLAHALTSSESEAPKEDAR